MSAELDCYLCSRRGRRARKSMGDVPRSDSQAPPPTTETIEEIAEEVEKLKELLKLQKERAELVAALQGVPVVTPAVPSQLTQTDLGAGARAEAQHRADSGATTPEHVGGPDTKPPKRKVPPCKIWSRPSEWRRRR